MVIMKNYFLYRIELFRETGIHDYLHKVRMDQKRTGSDILQATGARNIDSGNISLVHLKGIFNIFLISIVICLFVLIYEFSIKVIQAKKF